MRSHSQRMRSVQGQCWGRAVKLGAELGETGTNYEDAFDLGRVFERLVLGHMATP